MTISRTLNQDFFKTWSPEMAYVLGYFAADGSMLKNNRGGYYIEFTSADRILLDHVQKVTGSNHKINQRTGDARKNPEWKTTYRIQIGSKVWFEDLERLGFTQNKSNTLKFPDISDEFFGHFTRGYFDGDGCVYFKEHFAKDRRKYRWVFQVQFVSGSGMFLRDLHHRLRENIVKGGHIYVRRSGASNLLFSWFDSLALYRFMYNTSGVSGLFLPRKREKFEQAIQMLNLENKCARSSTG